MAEQAAEQKPKEGEKPKGQTTLDRVVNEVWNGIVNPLIAAGAIGASYRLFGRDGLILALSFPLGRSLFEYAKADGKGKLTSGDVRDESISGAVFTGLTKYGVGAVNQVPKAFGLEGMVTDILGYSVSTGALAVGAATGLVLNPLLNAVYYPLQYLIQNKTFKGMGQDFKKNYVSSLIRTAPLSAITSVAVGLAYTMPAFVPFLFPYFALSGIAYRVLMSPEKINYLKLAFAPIILPIYGAYYLASGAVGASVSTVKGLASLVYNIFRGAHETGLAFGRTAPAAQPTR